MGFVGCEVVGDGLALGEMVVYIVFWEWVYGVNRWICCGVGVLALVPQVVPRKAWFEHHVMNKTVGSQTRRRSVDVTSQGGNARVWCDRSNQRAFAAQVRGRLKLIWSQKVHRSRRILRRPTWATRDLYKFSCPHVSRG